jgi:hypothetical protein
MGVGAAARKRLPLVALALIPIMFHFAIVEGGRIHPAFIPGLGPWLKLGVVTVAALAHWAIYSALLLTFGATLWPGREPLISMMTRQMHGTLSDELATYTRRVTIAWCGFFAAQLTMSIMLFCFAPLAVWSFFVNMLDLPLVALMFAAEYQVRLRCLRDPPRHSLSVILSMIADVRKPRAEPAGSL